MYRFLPLRDATWLTADRVVAVGRVLLVCWLGLLASIPWTIPTMQVGRDFAAFWTAGRFALDGRALDAYADPGRDALLALFGPGDYAPFFYPPTALLIWIPFALLPFVMAALCWVTGTAIAYAAAIRAMLPGGSLALTLAFPAVVVSGLYGQNSLLSGAIFGAAAVSLSRYPGLAGILLGCLAYKPQLAILVPVALASAGRWRAFLAAAATAMGLMLLSVFLFGVKTWMAFGAVLPEAGSWNADGNAGFAKYASPYAAVRLLGGSATSAWAVQGFSGVLAAVALVAMTRRRPGGAAEIAMLVVATGFCVPFAGQYDLVIFAVTGAWLVSEAIKTIWLPFERICLAVLYLSPLAIIAAAANGIPLAPAALILLAALVVRRILRFPSAGLVFRQM